MQKSSALFFATVVVACGGTTATSGGNDGGTSSDATAGDGGGDAKGSGCGAGCPPSKTCCSDRCVTLDSNPEHCGSCATRCNTQSELCSAGSCTAAPRCGPSADGGACSAGQCCGQLCCPSGTNCVEDIPSFVGCCPVGDTCGCVGPNCPVGKQR